MSNRLEQFFFAFFVATVVSSGVVSPEVRDIYWNFALLTVALFIGVSLCWQLLEKIRSLVPGLQWNVLIIGNGPLAREMAEMTRKSGEKYRLAGLIECSAGAFGDNDRCSLITPEVLLAKIRESGANRIVVSLAERRGMFPLKALLNCKLCGVQIIEAPDYYERLQEKLMIENLSPSALIFSSEFRITALKRAAKRVLDIVLSLAGLVSVSPFIPFVAFLIKLDSRGPILFRQTRVGQGGKPFTIYKFRTMREDAEKGTGAVWAQNEDPRVTRVGKFLRKTRIDEIPQLFNVLLGTMSLVGPRPERPEFVQDLQKVIPFYSERHCVKPGITGWAQVRYPYGASEEDAREKLCYDMYYIKKYSVFFDIRILLRTIGVVLRKMGR